LEVRMVSAWDVYWVMQLDSISAGAGFLAFLSGAGMAILWAWGGFLKSDACDYGEESWRYKKGVQLGKALHKWALALTAVHALAFATAVLLPSSKTAAAMLVVPALTSDQVIEPATAEARELYGLAKQALTNLAEKKPEAEK
jgi:hypothetical protein